MKEKNPKVGSEEWLRGDETVYQKQRRKRGASSIAAVAGLSTMLPFYNSISNKSTHHYNKGLINEREAIEKELGPSSFNHLKNKQKELDQLQKDVLDRKVLPEVAKLQRNQILKEAQDLVPGVDINKLKKRINNAGKKAERAYLSKAIPKAALITAGVSTAAGVGFNISSKKKNEEKNREIRKRRLEKKSIKNFSEKDKTSHTSEILGAGAGLGAGLGATKLIETQGSKLAQYVAGKKEDRKLKKELKKIDKGSKIQVETLHKLGIPKDKIEEYIKDIHKKSELRKDLFRMGSEAEKKGILEGIKLGFKKGKFMNGVRKALPAAGIIVGVEEGYRLGKKKSKQFSSKGEKETDGQKSNRRKLSILAGTIGGGLTSIPESVKIHKHYNKLKNMEAAILSNQLSMDRIDKLISDKNYKTKEYLNDLMNDFDKVAKKHINRSPEVEKYAKGFLKSELPKSAAKYAAIGTGIGIGTNLGIKHMNKKKNKKAKQKNK